MKRTTAYINLINYSLQLANEEDSIRLGADCSCAGDGIMHWDLGDDEAPTMADAQRAARKIFAETCVSLGQWTRTGPLTAEARVDIF
jgi:hypothetical protein